MAAIINVMELSLVKFDDLENNLVGMAIKLHILMEIKVDEFDT